MEVRECGEGENGRCGGDVPDKEAAVSANFVEPGGEVVCVDVAECERVAGAEVSHRESDSWAGGEDVISVCVFGRFESEQIDFPRSLPYSYQVMKHKVCRPCKALEITTM